MTIVIGKRADCAYYLSVEGFSVFCAEDGEYSAHRNKEWILEGIARGDDVLLLSPRKASGQYLKELEWLLEEIVGISIARKKFEMEYMGIWNPDGGCKNETHNP